MIRQFTYASDDGGRILTSTRDSWVTETRAHTTDNTLASISYTVAAIGNIRFGRENTKNKTSEGITGTMSGYGFAVVSSGYDDEDCLVNWERDDTNLDQSWDLSLVGDWDSVTENASTQYRVHGDAHEIISAASQSITHDVKGNMTSIPAVLRPGSDPLALTWDFDNRMVSADVDNDSTDDVFYEWDALGRRVARDDGTTDTIYVQSGQQTIADYTSGTAATSPTYTYVYASYIDEPVVRDGTGGLRYYHRGQQYSINALTDSGGTIKERYAYDAYGGLSIFDGSGTARTSTAEGNWYTYTGREWDGGLGVYHFRARIYEPLLGRFLGRDPVGYIDGHSLYGNYFFTKNVDPSGLCNDGDCKISEARYGRQEVEAVLMTHNGPADFDFEFGDDNEDGPDDIDDLEDWLKKLLKKLAKKAGVKVKRHTKSIPSAHVTKLHITGLELRPTYQIDYKVHCCNCWFFGNSFDGGTSHQIITDPIVVPGGSIGLAHTYILEDPTDWPAFLRWLEAEINRINALNVPAITQDGVRRIVEADALKIGCCKRIVGGYDNGILPYGGQTPREVIE